jgi:phage replication-related protein YjqB (UPF0714/DUF867 family)
MNKITKIEKQLKSLDGLSYISLITDSQNVKFLMNGKNEDLAASILTAMQDEGFKHCIFAAVGSYNALNKQDDTHRSNESK